MTEQQLLNELAEIKLKITRLETVMSRKNAQTSEGVTKVYSDARDAQEALLEYSEETDSAISVIEDALCELSKEE